MTLNIRIVSFLLTLTMFFSFTNPKKNKYIYIIITEKVCGQCVKDLNEALVNNDYNTERYKYIYLSFYIPKRGNIQKQLYKEKYPNWSKYGAHFNFLEELPERLIDDSLSTEPSPIIYIRENSKYSKYELNELFDKKGKFTSYDKIFK